MVEPACDYIGKDTFADILSWPEGERWELIDGVAYDMTPTPSQRHPEILGNLFLHSPKGAMPGIPRAIRRAVAGDR